MNRASPDGRPDDAPPRDAQSLSVAEVLALAKTDALPPRWRMQLAGSELRPLVASRGTVVLERRAPTSGDVVCVATDRRVAWRRVLAVAGDEALIRAERAPFADGWTRGVIGCVALEGVMARSARAFPALWTSAGWLAQVALARVRATPPALRARFRPPRDFESRLLTAADARAFRDFYGPAWGTSPTLDLHPNTVTIGLFTPAGELVGTTALMFTEEREALSCGTVVAAKCRGRGGGQRMVAFALGVARELGMNRVVAHIRCTNHASLAAYRRVGFAPTGRWVSRPDDVLATAEYGLLELAVRVS